MCVFVCVCVCVSVCYSVSLLLMRGHSFERIWTKFGMWHPYTSRMAMSGLASAARAASSRCAPLQMSGEIRLEIGN